MSTGLEIPYHDIDALKDKCMASMYVDRLTDPVWLVPQPQNVPAMMQIARTLKSLKFCIPKVKDYYKRPLPLSNPRFPAFDTFEQPKYRSKKVRLGSV